MARPWLETLGVVALVGLTYLLGRRLSRLRKPYWAAGYVIPLLVIVVIGAARWLPAMEFIPPFAWLMLGRTEFAASAVACALFLAVLPSRLPRKTQKVLVSVLFLIVIVRYAVLPFLLPAVLHGRLSRLETKFFGDGSCRQTTRYTCGPAAAVTALKALGLQVQEGEVAILARTNPISGTQPDMLSAAIRARYGVSCEYRYFGSLDELREAGLTVALIKRTLLTDHYVVVSHIGDGRVTIADPLVGIRTLSEDEFRRRWRRCGIVLERRETRPSQ